MTNLELAQQQGNQAAPNLLAAAGAGELGGGGSLFPSLSTAGFVTAQMLFTLSSDQADEAAANTIYANCKLVTDNHIDLFILNEEYTDGSEGSEPSEYDYLAFSARALTHIKNLAASGFEVPAEILEILDTIEPDELYTFDPEDEADPVGALALLVGSYAMFGVDELPPMASGFIYLTFEQPSTDEDSAPVPSLPEGSSVYQLAIFLDFLSQNKDPLLGMYAVSHYAESLLDTPTKLDKTYYTLLA